LSKLFEESKIDLLTTLPKADRSKSRLDDILEERRLSFLFPLLKVQAEMMESLHSDPNPANLLDWILKNVDKEYHGFPGFTNALMTVVFRFVTQVQYRFLFRNSEPIV
jgi:translation initiation factor 4G